MRYDFSDLKDKNILLIGGFGLIGKELVKAFVKLQSKLLIADKVIDKELVKYLNQEEKKITTVKFDISSKNSIDFLLKNFKNKYKNIDVLINCSFPRTLDWQVDIKKTPLQSVRKNLLDHLGGYYYVSQQVAIDMSRRKKGSIINFSSIYGLVGPNFNIYEGTNMTTAAAYPLIKGGINTMTRYFASYFGKYNVRVNCISPGGVFDNQNPRFVKNYSKFTPLGRMATPKDFIMPVLFLSSNASSYITGHNLIVDGGWTII